MTIRHNTKFRKSLLSMKPARTDDIKDLLTLCGEDSNLQIPMAITRVIVNTGIRNCEFMNLRISNVDFENRLLSIEHSNSMNIRNRILPVRTKTISALSYLHQLNMQSEFILGDHPRTRFDYSIRKFKLLSPQVARSRLWTYSLRLNFAHRLLSAGIPSGQAKYCLGLRVKGSPFGKAQYSQEQKNAVLQRTFANFLEEL